MPRTEHRFPNELRQLGAAIRARREELGLTQEQLGHRADMDMTYVGRVERGAINLSYGSLVRFARALDTRVWELARAAEGN